MSEVRVPGLKSKVLVAMSGGVDSGVMARLSPSRLLGIAIVMSTAPEGYLHG